MASLFLRLKKGRSMSIFRALIAGYGAKKLGCGCFSTILVFLLLYWLLGGLNI
jgi:hypothetical protein